MGRLKSKSDYEALRNARILENQARLASLGLHKSLADLRSVISSANRNQNQPRRCQKKEYALGRLRRSDRLKSIVAASAVSPSPNNGLRRSKRLKGKLGDYGENEEEEEGGDGETESDTSGGEEEVMTPASGGSRVRLELSPEDSARRCRSSASGRGSVYNSIVGICCHFCRQKTLCAEEGCKRCGNMDVEQPCIGKTDCSVCHSTNGVLCRGCLKVRYGEEMEEVRKNKNWMCPHCIEEKGINPYWICNSSFCLKNRMLAPTGIAIFQARKLGYKSVAHLLMDELQKRRKSRGRRG